MKSYPFVLTTFIILFACQPTQDIVGSKSHTHVKTIAQDDEFNQADLANKSSERPSEEGVGLPGYSLFCGINETTSNQVEVGCRLVDHEGRRRFPPDVQTIKDRYQVKVSQPNTDLTITKAVPDDNYKWDILYRFTGFGESQLIELAMSSSYSYEEMNGNGQVERVDASPEKELTPDTKTNCNNGAIVDGICFFQSPRSCQSTCNAKGQSPHPRLIQIFSLPVGESSDSCQSIQEKIKGNNLFLFQIDPLGNGLGCYDTSMGTVFYDPAPLNLNLQPPIMGRVICACEA